MQGMRDVEMDKAQACLHRPTDNVFVLQTQAEQGDSRGGETDSPGGVGGSHPEEKPFMLGIERRPGTPDGKEWAWRVECQSQSQKAEFISS